MRDPVYRYRLLLAVLPVAVILITVPFLYNTALPLAVVIALPVVLAFVATGFCLGLMFRARPNADAPGAPPPRGSRPTFDERCESVWSTELPGTNQALRITVLDGELRVAWDGALSRWWSRVAAPKTYSAGLGFRVPLTEITSARRRRMMLPHRLWEALRPTQGLGLLGEWKYRVRWVPTGVSLRTSRGLRAWVSTSQPDELIAALSEAQRQRSPDRAR